MCTRVLLTLIFLLASKSLSAQGPTSGRLEGTVTDPSNAGITSATLTIKSQLNGQERKVITDQTGHWVVILLPPGTYRLTITAASFAAAIVDSIEVSVTETRRVDVKLEVAGPEVNVHVQPPLQSDGLQFSNTVDSRLVSELPLASRNFTQILSLSPGAATSLPDSTGVGRNTQTISFNGARMTQNNFQVNGVDANTMGTSSAINVAVPAPETLQEFKVQTLLFDSAFGRSGGGNVQIVTKSGGNEFHA